MTIANLTVERLDPTNVRNFDESTVFGDVWNDGSDSTYAVVDWQTAMDAKGDLPADTNSGPIATVTVRFRASATGPDDGTLVVELDRTGGSRNVWFLGGTLGDGVFTEDPFVFAVPNDGVTREYSAEVDARTLVFNGWGNLDEFRPYEGGELESGTCSLYAWAEGSTSRDFTIQIYEMWLEVGHLSPCFQVLPATNVTSDDSDVIGGSGAWSNDAGELFVSDASAVDPTYTKSQYDSGDHHSGVAEATAQIEAFALPSTPLDLTLYLECVADWDGAVAQGEPADASDNFYFIGCEPYLWTEDHGFLAGFYETTDNLFRVVSFDPAGGGSWVRSYTMTQENLTTDGTTLATIAAFLQTGTVNLSVRARSASGETGDAELRVYTAWLQFGYDCDEPAISGAADNARTRFS